MAAIPPIECNPGGPIAGGHANRMRAILPLVLVLATACETLNDEHDRHPDGAVATGAEHPANVERWGCGDFVDGCLFRCPVTLTADLDDESGTVKLAGIVKSTQFEIRGVERRWNWCLDSDGRFDCAFVIEPDGDGMYYDFASVMADDDGVSRAKPSELFDCRRMRTRGGGG